jgi:hypothetical protein
MIIDNTGTQNLKGSQQEMAIGQFKAFTEVAMLIRDYVRHLP